MTNIKIPPTLYGIILSIALGAVGLYTGYRLIVYRVDVMEPKVAIHETRLVAVETKMDLVLKGVEDINRKLDRRNPR